MEQLWIDFLIEFHTTRDYYKCHDYLEDLWVTLGKPKDNIYVGFLQLTVSIYHYRRENYSGARKVLEKSQEKLNKNKDKVPMLGVEYKNLTRIMNTLMQDIISEKPYYDINIPLVNELEKICINHNTNGKPWLSKSDLNNKKLVNKHIYKRDK